MKSIPRSSYALTTERAECLIRQAHQSAAAAKNPSFAAHERGFAWGVFNLWLKISPGRTAIDCERLRLLAEGQMELPL
jgi:hypothetical protein